MLKRNECQIKTGRTNREDGSFSALSQGRNDLCEEGEENSFKSELFVEFRSICHNRSKRRDNFQLHMYIHLLSNNCFSIFLQSFHEKFLKRNVKEKVKRFKIKSF